MTNVRYACLQYVVNILLARALWDNLYKYGQFNLNIIAGYTKFQTSWKLVRNWIANLCGPVDLLITSREMSKKGMQKKQFEKHRYKFDRKIGTKIA